MDIPLPGERLPTPPPAVEHRHVSLPEIIDLDCDDGPGVDPTLVDLDDIAMPPDEGDVEVLWHRASGRASTPPPVSPPRHRDAYSPSRPSGDDERGISPGVETLEAGGWKRRQERKLLQGGLGLPPPLPPPPLAPPSRRAPRPPTSWTSSRRSWP